MRESALAKRRWDAAAIEQHRADYVVRRGGGHAGLDERYERVEDFGRQSARLAHPGKARFVMQLDRAVARGGGRGGVGGGYGNIVVHGGDIGDGTPNCEGSTPLPLAGGVWGGGWRCQTLPAATRGTSTAPGQP